MNVTKALPPIWTKETSDESAEAPCRDSISSQSFGHSRGETLPIYSFAEEEIQAEEGNEKCEVWEPYVAGLIR